MICMVRTCGVGLWLPTRQLTEDEAATRGWRFQTDGKAPALSTGVALCPKCVAAGEEANWLPAAAKGRKTT